MISMKLTLSFIRPHLMTTPLITEVEIVSDKKDVSATRNELKTDDYNLLHLRSSYAQDAIRIDFGIENVLDKFYNDPLGGTYLGEGKTMAGTAVPWGTAVPRSDVRSMLE